jgi:WhiB family transcriptional regulator, redox-sensing transcriptional regulator
MESSYETEPSIWKNFDAFLTTIDNEPPLLDSERFVSFSLEDLYPDWQKESRCLGVGNDYFFGDEKQQPTMSIKQVRQASKLCDVCPVYRECLRWALENREEYGVWAGTSGRVRRKIQRLLEANEVTVDQVVEDFTHGRRDRYAEHAGTKGRSGDRHLGSVSELQSRASLRNEAVG